MSHAAESNKPLLGSHAGLSAGPCVERLFYVWFGGRGTEMSEGGMTLYAGILLNPGDLLEAEFDCPSDSRVPAIVDSKSGFCFGPEFITLLPSRTFLVHPS